MGMFDELRLKNKYKKEGRLEEYESYKAHLQSVQADIIRFTKYISDAQRNFESIKQKYPEGSREYNYAKDQIDRWKYELDKTKLMVNFVRPNSEQDIEYRNRQCEEFIPKLQSVISPSLDLRFHGTPIFLAEQIIRSGGITSTADRYDGYISSTDRQGEISASNIDSLGRTINFFSDMVAYDRSLPAGCIFAVYPKDAEDANYGHDLLHSVDFRQNPEQLFGIFTTPENIPNVQNWLIESGFEPNLVYTFEGFIEAVKQKSNEIDGITTGHTEQIEGSAITESLENIQDQTIGNNQGEYSFSSQDAKGVALKRRSGSLLKLQTRLKQAIRGLRKDEKVIDTKDRGGDSDDRTTRD